MKNQRAVLRIGEPFRDRSIKLLDERIKVGIDIQQAYRFGMEPKLSPRHDLTKLFKRAEATRKGDKPVGNLHHHGFSFMHGSNDSQLADILTSDLAGQKRAGNNADDLSSPALYGL